MLKRKNYRDAIAKAEEVMRRAAKGDLEARVVGVEEFGEMRGFFDATNDLLDLVDAYVRESGTSLAFASQQKFFRPFILRGMPGAFRDGARIINESREKMKVRHALTEGFQDDVREAVTVVAGAAGTLRETASALDSDAENAHSLSLTIATASEESAVGAEGVAAATEQLSASISEISRQVSRSSDVAQRVVVEVEGTNGAVQVLTEAAEQINKVLGFISDIAGKTNLLSLNATIEASRAGEAGKGFAVVANEVKALAKQSAEAASEIVEQIKALQDASQRTVTAMAGITTLVAEASEISAGIASAVEEQSSATEEISHNVQQVADGARSISREIGEVSQASERTGERVKDALSAAEGLATESRELDGKVGLFIEGVRHA